MPRSPAAASAIFGYLAVRENPYAAPVVKIQWRAGTTSSSPVLTGLCATRCTPVPILFFLGTPLLLGSWYGLALAPLLIAVLAVRALLEADAGGWRATRSTPLASAIVSSR